MKIKCVSLLELNMQQKTFSITTNKEDIYDYTILPQQFTFYQICHFDIDKKHNVRKIVFDETDNIVKCTESWITKKVLNNFIKGSPKYKYLIYPSYDLKQIQMPDGSDILLAKSNLLKNNS